MITTPWRNLDAKTRIRATYGLQRLSGNSEGYLSVTGETEEFSGRWREASCGCLHELIAKAFPELVDLIPFHLTNESGIPMHYEANALYWLGVANFTVVARDTPADALRHFKNSVLWGSLSEDRTDEIPSLKAASKWLSDRLPKLQEMFKVVLKKHMIT